MASQWIPPDISQVCAETTTSLTACSQTGLLYLTLLAQLYGHSKDDEDIPRKNPYIEAPLAGIEVNTQEPTLNPASKFNTKDDEDISRNNPYIEAPLAGIEVNTQETTLNPALKFNSKDDEAIPTKNPYIEAPLAGIEVDNQEPALEPTLRLNAKILAPLRPVLPLLKPKRCLNVAVQTKKPRKKKRRVKDEYDFIIVGAGSAGCVLANRLSEIYQWKVLLIEAGPEEPGVTSIPAVAPVLASSSIDWGYRTQPEKLSCLSLKEQRCRWTRGKTMGGSSAINYMVYMRGNKADYDGWAAAGNPGWSYREVLQYFKKAENNQNMNQYDKLYHSQGGPLNVERFQNIDNNTLMLVQAFKDKDLPVTDFNGANQLGTGIAQSTSYNGQRFSVNSAYIKPIRHSRVNLKIVTQAYVTKTIIDPATKTAIGVEYVKQGVVSIAYAAKEVILSAGAINSPKLLMLSGVGTSEYLTRHNITVISNLKVGHNLQDHVTTNALIISLSQKTATSVDRKQLIDAVYDYYEQPPHKNGSLASTSTINAVAFYKTEFAKQDLPDIQFHFNGRNIKEFYDDPSSSLATNIFPLSYYSGLSVKPLLLVPKSRGYIMLNHTDPIFGPPLIHPRFFTEQNDLDVLISSIRFVTTLENTSAFKQNGAYFVKVPIRGCEKFSWGTTKYFSCLLTHYTTTIFHPAGTCKMGPKSDTDAVVDSRLRVYGIKKLRVVDASIMPQIVRANLNAPTIMIAEKASDLIKEDHC